MHICCCSVFVKYIKIIKMHVCFQVYPGQSTGGQYAMGSAAVPGYNVPMEQIPQMNQTGTPMPGQPAPRYPHIIVLFSQYQ